jgi:hypothetical protein
MRERLPYLTTLPAPGSRGTAHSTKVSPIGDM